MSFQQKPKVIRFILIILSILVITPCLYLTLLRQIDALICIPKISQRVGIAPNLDAVYKYVGEIIQPGLTKAEALEKLSRIGKVTTLFVDRLANGNVVEEVDLSICYHPMNNIQVMIKYSPGGVIIGSYFVDFP
jgi:hypothetical protein